MSRSKCLCQADWCGFCYENIRGRANRKGHRGYREPRAKGGVRVVLDLRRRSPSGEGGDVGGLDPADRFAPLLPELLAFLTAAEYPGGGKRVPGSLSLFWDAGMLKGALNDKDSGMVAFVSAGGLAGLLETLERGLKEDKLVWRPSAPRKPRR